MAFEGKRNLKLVLQVSMKGPFLCKTYAVDRPFFTRSNEVLYKILHNVLISNTNMKFLIRETVTHPLFIVGLQRFFSVLLFCDSPNFFYFGIDDYNYRLLYRNEADLLRY